MDNTVNDSSQFSKDFRTAGIVKLINEKGQEEIKVPMDHTITNTEIDPKYVDSLLKQIIEFLQSNPSPAPNKAPGFKIKLPLINSGGRAYGSILHVTLIPSSNLGTNRNILICLQREEDMSADTIAGQIFPYNGEINPEFEDNLRKHLVTVLTDCASLLASRASLRAGFNEYQARKELLKDQD